MDFEKLATAANVIDETIRENEALKSIIVETSTAMIGDQSDETRQSIQEFLDAPLGDKKELAMKKAVSAAMILAKEKGTLTIIPNTSAEIAAVVDEGLTRIKANYQVGNGIIEPEVAIDNLVDHAESRALAYVDAAFDSGLVRETVAEGITQLAYAIPDIGPILGPAVQAFQPIIESFIAKVEKPVKNAIKTGIKYVATTAKSIAKAAVEKTKSFAKNVAKNVISWLA